MINNVLNFSLRLKSDKPFVLLPQMRVGIVPTLLDAVDAAVIAETHNYQVIIVVEDGRPKGLFFPDYLAKVLPGHHRIPFDVSGAPVSEIIRRLDAAGVDFHSEKVNEYLWSCPLGHVTDGNPCPDHGLPTTEY